MTFTVIGCPMAKQRARHYVRGNTGRVGTYTPPETVNYENLVAMCANEAIEKQSSIDDDCEPVGGWQGATKEPTMFKGALILSCNFWFPVPTTRSKGKHAIVEGQPHTQRPDADNCKKAIMDGCNKVLWLDDCSIYRIVAEKRWTYGQPRAVVTVEEL